MMMRAVRLNVLAIAVLLLLYGAVMEHHEVTALNGAGAVKVNGTDFIEGATWEAFALHDGKLVTEKAPSGTQSVQEKDCKT
jgi:hypothetical protein